jgi:hypothetical protein
MNEIITAITTALQSGNTGLATTLTQLLHVGSSQQGLDFKNKTMTTTWYSSNQATAISLVASGWTIIPG